jgi:hypothetical protein
MNLYEHFFWNYAIFCRKPWAWKVAIGGISPDLLYMVGFIPKILSYGSFAEWMRDPLWTTIWNSPVAKSAHSFVVWGAISLIFFQILERNTFRWVGPFLLGWGLHILFDMFTHVSDGYPLFYPVWNIRFPAPVSYWEVQFHARTYFWISHLLMASLLLLWVLSKFKRLFYKRNSSL